MRECRRCGNSKPLKDFRESKPGYRRRVCAECMDTAAVRWQESNRERLRAWRENYYQANRSKQIKMAKKWNKANPERKKVSTNKHYQRLKDASIAAYGGAECACCGESEPMFMSIDHVNNDGHIYSKKLGKPHAGLFLYRWLKNNHYPPGFQVLCFSCNQGKHLNRGICPHQIKKV